MIIEFVSSSGLVLDHKRFDATTIKIGRAYDNDLIVHDPHVDALHLKLSYDSEREGFWYEDLNSVNGTQLFRSKENRHRKVPANFVCSGDTLCVGKTRLKIRSREQDVPAAVKISAWDKFLTLCGNIWFVAIQCILLIALETYSLFIGDPRPDKLGSKFLEAIDVLFLIIAYSLVWAFIARVQKSEPRLLVHASLICSYLLLVSFIDLVKPIFYFNFQLVHFSAFIEWVLDSALLFLIIWSSLYLATELKKVLRFLMAALLPFGFLLSLVVNVIQRPEFRSTPNYDSLVVAPRWQWREGIDRDSYITNTAELYQEVDAEPGLELENEALKVDVELVAPLQEPEENVEESN